MNSNNAFILSNLSKVSPYVECVHYRTIIPDMMYRDLDIS
jgi:hypothetical protein